MIFANRLAVQLDRLPRQGIGNGPARLAGDDVVPDFPQIGIFPEVGLEGVCPGHDGLPCSLVVDGSEHQIEHGDNTASEQQRGACQIRYMV
jgi:hypothetical protein